MKKKNAFYYTLKDLFVLKVYNFCLDFWQNGHTARLER